MPDKNTQTMSEVTTAVVAQDKEIRDSLKGLVDDMIHYLRHTMRHGDPAQKLQLSKQIVMPMLTAINKVDASEEEAAERAAYQRLMRELRGEGSPIPEEQQQRDEPPPAAEDTPPPKPPVKRQARKKAAPKK